MIKSFKTILMAVISFAFIMGCSSRNMNTKAEKEAKEVQQDGDTVDARTTTDDEGSLGKRFMEPDSL